MNDPKTNDAISRSAVLNELIEAKSQVSKVQTDYAEIINETLDIFANTINKQPALDVVPVVHARWIPYDEARPGLYFSHRCSNCGGSVEHAYLMRPSSFSDFCPNCGAKMDEEVSCDPD